MKLNVLSLAISTVFAASAANALDFGQKTEQLAKAQSLSLFGTLGTLGASSSLDLSAATIDADPASAVTLAPGLTAKVVSAAPTLGANIDQMALWPNDSAPTHLIACNEQGSNNVALQRIKISDGSVEDIVSSGLTSCDPVRRTAWGTIVFGEENGTNGRMFELLDPLTTNGVTITGSLGTTTSSDPAHVAYLPALGALSFEGFALYPNGVVYYGDENRPGNGNPGGAYFKFIPTHPYAGDVVTHGSPAIATLAESPLVSGSIYGFRAGKRSGASDYGQANEFGRGTWVAVTGAAPINLRTAGQGLKLTGYYRPEDLEVDPKALATGKVRFCGNNTGEDSPATATAGDNNFGTAGCFTDGTVAEALANTAVPEYQPLVVNHIDFGMPDNIAFQPGRTNILINEDGEGSLYSPARNNDIWSCLDDGADKDNLADACVKVLSINDLTAETTGGIFDATGKHYYVSIQHNKTGHGLILDIQGWQ